MTVPPIMTVKLSVCAETAIAAQRAMKALFEVTVPVCGDPETPVTDASELFRCEFSHVDDVLRILPSNLYLDLVAGVSEKLGLETTLVDGWPILSVVSPNAPVAEGAAPANAAPEAGQ